MWNASKSTLTMLPVGMYRGKHMKYYEIIPAAAAAAYKQNTCGYNMKIKTL